MLGDRSSSRGTQMHGGIISTAPALPHISRMLPCVSLSMFDSQHMKSRYNQPSAIRIGTSESSAISVNKRSSVLTDKNRTIKSRRNDRFFQSQAKSHSAPRQPSCTTPKEPQQIKPLEMTNTAAYTETTPSPTRRGNRQLRRKSSMAWAVSISERPPVLTGSYRRCSSSLRNRSTLAGH
jgi:cell division septation protein DedD